MEVDWISFLWSLAALTAAAMLLVLEVLVVSFGLLLIAAIACAGVSIWLAFDAHETIGWISVVLIPLGAAICARWGITRIRASRVVPKSEITADAGYHHLADRLAIGPGSEGVMVTPARPVGRARFEGGECDVQVRGPALQSGAPIKVERIDGPIVFVASAQL